MESINKGVMINKRWKNNARKQQKKPNPKAPRSLSNTYALLVLITLGSEIFILGFSASKDILETLLLFDGAVFLVMGILAAVGFSDTMVPGSRGTWSMSFAGGCERREGQNKPDLLMMVATMFFIILIPVRLTLG
jgi:hypothetical protein